MNNPLDSDDYFPLSLPASKQREMVIKEEMQFCIQMEFGIKCGYRLLFNSDTGKWLSNLMMIMDETTEVSFPDKEVKLCKYSQFLLLAI